MTSGTNPVGEWALPYSTGPSVDDPTSYKGKIDSGFAVAQRIVDVFAPRPASPAAMAVAIDAGYIVATGPGGLQSVTEIGAQTVAIATAPAAPNNRIDLIVVDAASGAAGVIAGTPAGSPVAPPLTAGQQQIAQISIPNGTTAIGNANIADLRAIGPAGVPGIRWTVAGGAADAITASYTPANTALADGLVLGFRAAAANATAAPSFNADGLGAKTIVKQGGRALLAGEIPGPLGECLLRYNAANTRWELLNPAPIAPRGYIGGLILANVATNTFGVGAGMATSDDGTMLMIANAGVTKSTAAWAAGSGNGALDTGTAAANTWYHVFLIERIDTGAVDHLISLSVGAPAMPASYTRKRRIGSICTDGAGNIKLFQQVGDTFLWLTNPIPNDVAVGNLSGAAGTLFTLSVPPGVNVTAIFNANGADASGANQIFFTPPAAADNGGFATLGRVQLVFPGGVGSGSEFQIVTDTFARIRARAVTNTGTCQLYIATMAWVDMRGRFD